MQAEEEDDRSVKRRRVGDEDDDEEALPWKDLVKIGQGTYGEVYKAKPVGSRREQQGSLVALKRLVQRDDDWGFPVTSLRERKILLGLRHANLVRLFEMYQKSATSADIYMVFEYVELDLEMVIQSPAVKKVSVERIKSFMQQLLEGVDYMHRNEIMHRDLKPSNLLVFMRGDLKVCDFGLARVHARNAQYTWPVITLHYRPPELMLGWRRYSPAVDIWSVGAIFAELLLRKVALPGRNDADYLAKLWQLCGPPDAKDAKVLAERADAKLLAELCPAWPKVKGDKDDAPRRLISDKFEPIDPLAAPLLDRLLALDPNDRLNAGDALDDDYFWQGPKPLPEDKRHLDYDADLVRSAHDDHQRRLRSAYQQQQLKQNLQSSAQQENNNKSGGEGSGTHLSIKS